METSTAETVEAMIHFLAYHNYMGPVNSLCEILTEGGFEIAEGTKLKLRCFLCFAHDYVANSVKSSEDLANLIKEIDSALESNR
mmetsp:Transcript_19070/g.43227  ORF Transcript_19070/g.43227 Transcript_19070/m.43227 type:complete len:84 (-) Transcript_19070:14-265(-)